MHHGHVERLEFGVLFGEQERFFEGGLRSRRRRGSERMAFLRDGGRSGLGSRGDRRRGRGTRPERRPLSAGHARDAAAAAGAGSVGAQFLAGRFAGPGARINLAHDGEHFLGGLHGLEVAHVQAEALAAVLETTAHEEGVLSEGRILRLRQRHRRRRRGQIDDITARGGCTGGSRQRVHDVIWLGAHVVVFPEKPDGTALPSRIAILFTR